MPPFVSLLLVLLVVGALIYFVLPVPMALKLLRPPRMSDGKAVYVLKRLTPMDLGMNYEEVSFAIRDEQTGEPLRITGWWIETPGANRTAILIHGYADAKVGAIAWAPLFGSLGYHVLAVDLRAHGGSGGRNVTAGFWERHDLSQVIDQLRGEQAGEIVLFGVSLGAAVVIAVGALREDLAAVIVESPFADYPTAVVSHADLMGMPGPGFVRRAIRRAERVSGADFAAVAPARLIPEVKCPVMVISAGKDPLVGGSLVELEKAVGRRGDGSVFWKVDGAYHVESMVGDAAEYRRRIEGFLAMASSAWR